MRNREHSVKPSTRMLGWYFKSTSVDYFHISPLASFTTVLKHVIQR